MLLVLPPLLLRLLLLAGLLVGWPVGDCCCC
jgi:hypothetical protein